MGSGTGAKMLKTYKLIPSFFNHSNYFRLLGEVPDPNGT